jgi:hypothetical protein
VYKLISGKRAFPGESAASVVAGVERDPVPISGFGSRSGIVGDGPVAHIVDEIYAAPEDTELSSITLVVNWPTLLKEN